MKIILICKGSGSSLLTNTMFKNIDKFAWANMPIFNNNVIELPKQIDIIYLRKSSLYNELPRNLKEMYDNIGFGDIISSGDNFNTIGNYKVKRNISPHNNGFNMSTGLIAFEDIVKTYKPNNFIVSGLDLFEEGKPIYFYDFQKNITNHINKKRLENGCLSDDNNTIKKGIRLHYPNKSLSHIYDIVKNNANIDFTYLTTNNKIKDRLKELNNVEVITK